jgi:hypothetical protein
VIAGDATRTVDGVRVLGGGGGAVQVIEQRPERLMSRLFRYAPSLRATALSVFSMTSRPGSSTDPRRDQAGLVLAVRTVALRSSDAGARVAGYSTSAMTRLDMNRAVRTGAPDRVTSLTSTRPRRVAISIRRPARVAVTSYVRESFPASTTISTRSPFTPPQCTRRARIASVPTCGRVGLE